MADQPQTLAQMVRSKYPGQYDDMNDQDLEAKVLQKYPQYADLPRSQAGAPANPQSDSGAISRFVTEAARQLNPITAVQGMKQAAAHPIDTLKADADNRQQVYDQAEKSFKQGDYVGGAAHLLYSFVPFIGPQLDEAGQKMQQGNIAGGLGQSIGLGTALAVPGAIKAGNIRLPGPIADAAQATAESLYRKALKPSTALPAAKASQMVETGLNNQVPVSPAGLEKLSGLIDDVNQKIASEIAARPNQPINPAQAVKNLAQLRSKFSAQVNPASDVAAIDAAKNEFLDQFRSSPGSAVRNMTASEAQAMKQGTYRALGDKAYGELKGATIESQKVLAAGLKEELAKAFPELNALNAQDSALLQLQPALERAVARTGNNNFVGIGAPLVGGAAKAISGSGPVGAVAATLKAAVDMPAVRSQLAFAIAKASKGGISFPAAMAKVSAYSNALGNAVQGPQAPE